MRLPHLPRNRLRHLLRNPLLWLMRLPHLPRNRLRHLLRNLLL
jgi:hypothetical protein